MLIQEAQDQCPLCSEGMYICAKTLKVMYSFAKPNPLYKRTGKNDESDTNMLQTQTQVGNSCTSFSVIPPLTHTTSACKDYIAKSRFLTRGSSTAEY